MSTKSSRTRLGSYFSQLKSAKRSDEGPDLSTTDDSDLQAATRDDDGYQPYVSPGLRLAASWSWRSLLVIAAVTVAIYGLSFLSIIVLPLLLALLIAALLAPLTGWLNRHGMPQVWATIVSFFGAIILVVGLFTLVGQQLISGFSDLTGQAVEGFYTVRDWLMDNPFGIDSQQLATWMDDAVQQAMQTLQSNSSSILGGAVSAGASVGTFVTGLILTLFTAFFFLYDGKSIFRWTVNLLPRPARARTKSAAERGWHTLVQYVRVQIFVAFVDAVGIALGAFFLGLPLVIPLGVLVFLASFVPIVGAVTTGALAVLIALVTQGPVPAIIMLGVVILVQQLESNFLQPFIMGKAVSVHPLAVVLGVTAGGFLAGIPGAVFAVPLLAVANTVVKHLASTGRGAPPPPDPGEEAAKAAVKGSEDSDDTAAAPGESATANASGDDVREAPTPPRPAEGTSG